MGRKTVLATPLAEAKVTTTKQLSLFLAGIAHLFREAAITTLEQEDSPQPQLLAMKWVPLGLTATYLT